MMGRSPLDVVLTRYRQPKQANIHLDVFGPKYESGGDMGCSSISLFVRSKEPWRMPLWFGPRSGRYSTSSAVRKIYESRSWSPLDYRVLAELSMWCSTVINKPFNGKWAALPPGEELRHPCVRNSTSSVVWNPPYQIRKHTAACGDRLFGSYLSSKRMYRARR